jgi:hypothetical protein
MSLPAEHRAFTTEGLLKVGARADVAMFKFERVSESVLTAA